MNKKTKTIEIPEILNGVENPIKMETPYVINVEIIGACALIFHRWSCEDVASKAAAKKGSKEKKTDNVESFIYRDQDGHVCLPGEYLRMAMVYAAKFRQDPRSPRKVAGKGVVRSCRIWCGSPRRAQVRSGGVPHGEVTRREML